MRIRIPSKRVCRRFHLTYELKGAQKGVDVLTEYYGIRRMKIVVDGRKVGKGDEATYYKNKAYLTRRGLNRYNVLHESYHHLAESKGLEVTDSKEERKPIVLLKRFAKI